MTGPISNNDELLVRVAIYILLFETRGLNRDCMVSFHNWSIILVKRTESLFDLPKLKKKIE